MDENLHNAKNEIRRAEHLFFVSLKYTRTADVLRNVVERLINCFEFGVDIILEQSKKEKTIEEIPKAPRAKSDLLREKFSDDPVLMEYVDFYILLRDIRAAPYTKKEEYRRHVAMISEIFKGKFVEVNIDVLSDYLKKAKSFVEYIEERYKPK